MKQEWPTYLKSIGKSKALAATLSDTEPEADLEDSDQEGTVNAFTTTVDLSKESKELADEEEAWKALQARHKEAEWSGVGTRGTLH